MFRIPIRADFDLRLAVPSLASPLFAVVDRNREHLRPWLPWVDHTWSPEDIRRWIARGLEQFQRDEGWHAVLWFQDQPAGSIGFKAIDWTNLRVEIGYWLATEFQGRGLMTDAVRVATNYAFNEWGLNRVDIRCAVENHRSAAVARRLGFAHEGTLRQAFRVGDLYQDLSLFGMLRREWDGLAGGGKPQ